MRLLTTDFYERNTLEVARDLLGKILVVKRGRKNLAGRIVETEGYHGDDPASHSFRGRTPRCAPMFESPGRAYVYFIYGMYEMLNFVTEREGTAGAVLIRAIEPMEGITDSRTTDGPGKLCRALGIRRSHNRSPLQGPKLFVYDDGFRPESISASPRVGIRDGRERPWRYFVTGHPSVSRAKENRQARPWRASA